MSSVLIVLPILSLLMFDLGLTLGVDDFAMVARRPRAVLAGLTGQILLLPAVVFILCKAFGISGPMFFGLMLIACCPGGSSSNVFSGIAKGDVALSVSLTALSSIITLFTLPLFLGSMFKLPVGNLVMQNLVLVLVPVLIGMLVRHYREAAAERVHNVLKKLAFPLLMLLAGLFFIGNRKVIVANFAMLGGVITLMILLAMSGGWFLGWLARLNGRERRTLVIEVGMQNAAQAIALSTSPLVFNDPTMAVPAIVYALMMNVVLLIYVAIMARWKS
ncbi:MAG: bile acid:sodium symporter family protein [Bacteroides sp.]|nr:bile acid:sodium symporter family protein [Bacteroides sp.]MCM1379444.1 bile acid:sodium symporter family protein [Bacteroides sp.]MCM1445305.1 bile acid:sodium symporter family protein [Prevotella sp.]